MPDVVPGLGLGRPATRRLGPAGRAVAGTNSTKFYGKIKKALVCDAVSRVDEALR